MGGRPCQNSMLSAVDSIHSRFNSILKHLKHSLCRLPEAVSDLWHGRVKWSRTLSDYSSHGNGLHTRSPWGMQLRPSKSTGYSNTQNTHCKCKPFPSHRSIEQPWTKDVCLDRRCRPPRACWTATSSVGIAGCDDMEHRDPVVLACNWPMPLRQVELALCGFIWAQQHPEPHNWYLAPQLHHAHSYTSRPLQVIGILCVRASLRASQSSNRHTHTHT